MRFTISRNLTNLATITAISYSDAADKYARKTYGRKCISRRTTGEHGKSGYFQAYAPVVKREGGGLSSIGEPFHVQ